jgi:hypothetical protein
LVDFFITIFFCGGMLVFLKNPYVIIIAADAFMSYALMPTRSFLPDKDPLHFILNE